MESIVLCLELTGLWAFVPISIAGEAWRRLGVAAQVVEVTGGYRGSRDEIQGPPGSIDRDSALRAMTPSVSVLPASPSSSLSAQRHAANMHLFSIFLIWFVFLMARDASY